MKQYDGGYDDYLRQRPAEPASQSRPNPDVPKKKPADAPRERSRKLSFKERKELDGMPGRIEQLKKTAQDLHAAMAEPSFYRQDRDEIAARRSVWRTLSATWPLPTRAGTPWKSLPADSTFSLTYQGSLRDRSRHSEALL